MQKISIKTITGKTYEFDVKSSDTIRDIKNKIYEQLQIPIESQKIIYNGELECKDSLKINDFVPNVFYLINKDEKIEQQNLINKQIGGKKDKYLKKIIKLQSLHIGEK
jgi:hypothetical protein